MKQNCWEYKQCGRQPGGVKVPVAGLCPAAIDTTADGINGGKNGGRLCWMVAGTYCEGKREGTFAQKRLICMNCDFCQKVETEEGINFIFLPPMRKAG